MKKKVFFIFCLLSCFAFGGTGETPSVSTDFGAYLAGRLAHHNKDLNKTAYYYTKALHEDPQNIHLLSTIYLFNTMTGDFKDMAQILNHLKDLGVNTGLYDFSNVALATKKGDFAGALQYLPKKEKEDAIVPLIRAWIYAGLHDKEMAFQALEPLKKLPVPDLYPYHKGLLALSFKDEVEADKNFRSLTTLRGISGLGLSFIRSFYQGRGAWNTTNPLFKQWHLVFSQNPLEYAIAEAAPPPTVTVPIGLAEAFFEGAVALNTYEAYDQALILNALALYLNDSDFYKLFGGIVFEKINAYAQANALYDRMHTHLFDLKVQQQVNLIHMGDLAGAEKGLKNLYAKDSYHPTVLLLLAEIYRDTDRAEIALPFYTRLFNILPANTDKAELSLAYLSRSKTYDALGKKDLMEQDLQKVLKLIPNHPVALNDLGYSWLEQNKNIDAALDLIQQAAKIVPHDPYIWDSLAFGYYKKQEYTKALTYAEQVADALPGNALVNAHLGDIYAALGRKRESRFQYRKALDLKQGLTPALKQELQQKLRAS